MTILVNMKNPAKKKNSIRQVPFQLARNPSTVRELIEEIVLSCVKDYNARAENSHLIKNLTQKEMTDQAAVGKVGFGTNYGENKADETQAVENALQCFEDGLYRIFLGTVPLTELKEEITLTDGSELTFVRLVMLAGRMW